MSNESTPPPPNAGDGASPVQRVFIVKKVSEEHMRRLLEGGRKALEHHLAKHSAKLRAAIGL